MFIIHIAAEIAPVAKVGGLGDVICGLSRELISHGHQVAVIIPKYDCLETWGVKDLQVVDEDLWSLGVEGWTKNLVWAGLVEDIPVFFIEPLNRTEYFNRGRFYNCDDDAERFLYFSRAALEFLQKSNKHPDVLHLHDWHTAIAAPLYRDIYSRLGLHVGKIVLTVHNFEYQGQYPAEELQKIGLDPLHYNTPERLQDNIVPTLINFLKGGIVYANAIVTVSPNYAREVLHHLGGKGIETTLRQYSYKFLGILNGLDYDYWNPETDRYLPIHFSADDEENFYKNKEAVKTHLKKRLGFAMDHRPIVSCIVRLVPQKGIDLIYNAVFRTLKMGGQFIFLGTSPFPSVYQKFRQLKLNLGNNPNVHFELNYNEELSHQIYAGSDMFLVPSLVEPCGLTQLISLRYGTIPIVRRTGGLADTIFDIEYSGKPLHQTNGFSFDHPNDQGLNSALDRAICCWYRQSTFWQQLALNGMRMDFSWKEPSKHYLSVYSNF